MKTKRHEERLSDRRSDYGDKKVSNRIASRADEIVRQTGGNMADARSQALREMIAGMK